MRVLTNASVCTAAAFLLAVAGALAQEKVIGEWDDTVGSAWRQNIKIIDSDGKLFRVSTFPKGQPMRAELQEVKPKTDETRRFERRQSSDGEAYAIAPDGNLRLFDRDGLIREARRVR